MRLLPQVARLWAAALSYLRSLRTQALGKAWEPIPRIAGTGVRASDARGVRSLRRMMRRNAERVVPKFTSGRQWKKYYKAVQRATRQRYVDMPQYIMTKPRLPAIARISFGLASLTLFIALVLS